MVDFSDLFEEKEIDENNIKQIIERISGNIRLKQLIVNSKIFMNQGIEDRFFSSLGFINSLREICFVNLKSSLVRNLLQNKDLEKITIRDTAIKEINQKEFLTDLISNIKSENLREINFFKNSLSENSTKVISNLLQRNKKIETLDLGNNILKDLDLLEICQILENCQNLRYLKLDYNEFTQIGLEHISKVINKIPIQFLDLSYNNLKGSSEFFKTLQNNNSLETLVASYISDDINDFGELCNTLEKNTCLKNLKIGRIEFTQEIFHYYSNMLSKNKTIKELEFTRHKMRENGSLNFSKFLSKNHTLLKLVIDRNEIGLGIQRFKEQLLQNNTLKYLDISSNKIGANGALHLKEVIKFNRSIEFLNLSNNFLTKDGAHHLSEGLKSNKTLKSLILTSNEIGCDGVESIFDSLSNNTSITELGFRKNNIGNEGADIISNKINFISNLTKLDFSANNISKSAKDIAEALYSNDSITYLSLNANELSDEELEEFANILKTNRTLLNLDFRCNKGKNLKEIYFYLNANIPWEERNHQKFNFHFQEAVFSFLCVLKRINMRIPRPIFLNIVKFINRKKFFKISKK